MAGRIWTQLTLLVSAGLLTVGGWLVVDQQRALSRAESVPAQVVEADVAVTPWGTHRPRVVAEYTADGKARQTQRWSWMDVGGTQAWAAAATTEATNEAASPRGLRVWVDPTRPDVAWVDATPTAIPMVVWLGGVALLGAWWGVWRASRCQLAPAVATPMGNHGWYALRGWIGASGSVPTAWARVATGFIGGVPAIALHYIAMGGPITMGGTLAVVGWLGLTAWWVVRAARASAWSGRIVPPSVTVTRAVMSLEHDVVTRVKLTVRRPMVLRSVRMSLVCRRIDALSATELYRASAEDALERLASPSAPVTTTHGFSVPPRKRRASLSAGGERIAWAIEVIVKPEYGPPMTANYPIEAVHDTKAATPKPRLVGATRAA